MPRDFKVTEFKTIKEESLIGVISDTHIPTGKKKIPVQVHEIFKNVDLIVHAGDLITLEVVKELERIASVIAIHGNMDPPKVKEKLPQAVCLKIYGWKMGVIHDSVFPPVGWRMKKIAKENHLDILIFGHTHRPFLKSKDTLIINPGSPTNPLWSKSSVALLKVDKYSYEGKIVYLSESSEKILFAP